MKDIAEMSNEEVAGLVCTTLQEAGVTVTLTGGACVAIWSEGKYVSDDLDFIEEGKVPRQTVRNVLRSLGFREEGRHFVHERSNVFIEFPTGPLMVGDQRVQTVTTRRTATGTLRLLSPTDCVKDRLAAFFHWDDRQAMRQAVLVANAQAIDFQDVEEWAKSEGHEAKFRQFQSTASSSTRRASGRSAKRKRRPPS